MKLDLGKLRLVALLRREVLDRLFFLVSSELVCTGSGIASHLHTVGIVNQPVQNAIGHCRIADLFVPTGHGQLRHENQRADLITALADLPKIVALWF